MTPIEQINNMVLEAKEIAKQNNIQFVGIVVENIEDNNIVITQSYYGSKKVLSTAFDMSLESM